jgi:hypothetical protein
MSGGVDLISKREDPRFGIQNFEVTDIILGDPTRNSSKVRGPPETAGDPSASGIIQLNPPRLLLPTKDAQVPLTTPVGDNLASGTCLPQARSVPALSAVTAVRNLLFG